MLTNIQVILQSQYSVAEYIVYSWAIEIQAAADCLGINVYTFANCHWLE